MKIEEILSRLEGVRRTGPDKYVACCPAHDDNDPSFSIELKERKILMHCFAGCSKPEIYDAMGIKAYDLFLDDNYGKACYRKIDNGVDQIELDKTVLEIAAADMKAGRAISISDMARIKMARKRLSNG